MAVKSFVILIVCIILYFPNTTAHVSIHPYKNENVNSCDISLNLTNTGLRRLHRNFIDANCVRNLILQNNEIEYLEENSFENQAHLEYLDISRNNLKSSNFFTFGGSKSLKVLILDHNNRDVNDVVYVAKNNRSKNNESDYVDYQKLDIHDDFPELKYLSLRNVNVNYFPKNWIQHFPKLEYLDVSENSLADNLLSVFLKNTSSNIKTLVAEKIGLTMVRTEDLQAIEHLNLNHNHLLRLSSHKCHGSSMCFEDMDNLKVLSLSNCSVQFFEENAFKYMQNLLELDLSNNSFKKIPSQTFGYLTSLLSLNLSYNPLINMPNIEKLQSLTTLILDGMKNEQIWQSLQSFPHLPKLKSLSMRYNNLNTISPTLFDKLPALEKINLSNNFITFLPSWSNQKALVELDLSSNKIEDIEKLSLKDATSLKLLILKNNYISKMKISSLKDFTSSNVILDM